MLTGGVYAWDCTGYNNTNGADLFATIKGDLVTFFEDSTGFTLEGFAIGSDNVEILRGAYPGFTSLLGTPLFMAVFGGRGGLGYQRIAFVVVCSSAGYFLMYAWGQSFSNDAWVKLLEAKTRNQASIAAIPPYSFKLNGSETSDTCACAPPSDEYRRISIVVAPINVARTLNWDDGRSDTLEVGVSELCRSGLTVGTARTVEISAVDYEATQIVCGSESGDERHEVRLVPSGDAVNQITVVTNDDAIVTIQEAATFGDHTTLGEVYFTGRGTVAVDLARSKIWYITATRDYTRGRWVDEGDVVGEINLTMSTTVDPAPLEPSEDIPEPAPGRMMLRCHVQCPGTLSYDNAGFFDEVEPIVISAPGTYDYEIPPPQIGCDGGLLLFTCAEGDFQRKILFVENGTAELGVGPARVQLSSARSAQVYWDADSIFSWLPGDGKLVASVEAGHTCEFLISSSGYVNVAIIGTDSVVRFPVEFENGALVRLDATPGLTGAHTTDSPFSLGIAGVAVIGLVLGVLIGRVVS